MAGNFQQQMAGTAPNQIPNQMMAHMQTQDQAQMNSFQMFILSQIQNNTPPGLSGWQTSTLIAERFGHVSHMVSQLRLANSHMSNHDQIQLCNIAISFEKMAFEQSPDKITYSNKIQSKLHDLSQKRMDNVNQTQMAINNQAQMQQRMQAEAQAHMRASQQQQANMLQNGIQGPRPNGQQAGQQGFQHLSHQMQLSPIPQQQPQQMQVNGAPQPNGQALNQLQMMQQQRQMHQQGNVRQAMMPLTQQEQSTAHAIAVQKMQTTAEAEKQAIRITLQNRYPAMLAQAQQSNQDPIFLWFRNQAQGQLRQQKHARAVASQQQNPNNGGPSSIPMQPQRSGNPSSQQPGSGNPNFDPNFPLNAELIGQQHQAGILAQAEGQIVVPASNPQRISTPQSHGGIPGQQNQGVNPRQTPTQAQHLFAQQAQSQRAAAQSQQQAAVAAAAAQNRAVKMQQQLSHQGQLRGSGLGDLPPQQSPAMPTLNTPLRPPGQQPVHNENPQRNQGNALNFVGLDPRFNQHNPAMQRPAGMGNPMNPTMQFPPNMPIEKRHQLASLSSEDAMKFMKQWQESNGGNSGMPVNGQGNPRPGQAMTQNMGFVAQSIGNQPGGTGHQQLPPGMDQQQQQQLQARMAQMQQQRQPIALPPQALQKMDNLLFPRQVLGQRGVPQQVPQEVQNWGQLKQFVANSNQPPQVMEALKVMQAMQFRSFMVRQQQGGSQQPQHGQQPPTSQMVPPNMQAPVAPMAPMVQQAPPNQVGNLGMPRPSDEEVQATRQRLRQQHPNAPQLTDEQIRDAIMNNRQQRSGFMMQQQRMQAQMAQMPQNAQMHQQQLQFAGQQMGPQRGPPTFQSMQQTRPGSSQAGTSQQPPAPMDSGGPSAKRDSRNNQTERNETQNPSPATNSKSLKRSNSDDVVEVPNPNAQPRTLVQQQPQVSRRALPTPEQLAAMSPEHREKFQKFMRSQKAQIPQRIARCKQIVREETEILQRQVFQDIPYTADQRKSLMDSLTSAVKMVTQVSAVLEKWFGEINDEERLRRFLRMSKRFEQQFSDKELTKFKPTFSMKPGDVLELGQLMAEMIQELAQKNPSLIKSKQQPTAQLNASNLQQHQKQQQALSQQQAAHKIQHQRSASRNNVPAAPTTSHAPYQFGASAGSPQGNPVYSDKPPATTRDNIQLPKNKKQKMGSGNASATTSPQIPKTSSPNSKRPNVSKAELPVKTLICPEPDCGVGFASAEELKRHNNEQHIVPIGDPVKFVVDAVTNTLGFDSNGEALVQPSKPQTFGTPVANMEVSSSTQGQTPQIKFDPSATPSSMARQTSLGNPKVTHSSPAQQGANPPGTQRNNTPAQEQHVAEDSWAAAGINPNLLVNTYEPLSTNNEMWRSLTPNDTPESSKDGNSEPNSDISEGLDLTISLETWDSTAWDPFPGGDVQYGIGNLNFDDDAFMGEGAQFAANKEFTWEDIPFPSGPVPDISSHFMMNAE